MPAILIDEDGAAGFVGTPKPSIHGVQTYPAPRIAVGLEGRTSAMVAVLPRPKAAMDAANGVGMLTKHAPGPLHCTGEALYADDIPAPEDLLYGNLLIMSTRCHTSLVSINVAPTAPSRMMTSSGWAGKIVWGPSSLTAWRLSHWGTWSSTSGSGQVLGIIVGVSQEIAKRGDCAVAVQYEDLEGNVVVRFKDAIKTKSLWAEVIHEMRPGRASVYQPSLPSAIVQM